MNRKSNDSTWSEPSKVMIKLLLFTIAGIVFAGVIAVVAAMISQNIDAKPRPVEGIYLSDVLNKIGSERVERLSGPADRTDILYIGSPDCHVCRDYARGALPDTVSLMEKNGVSMAHIQIATGRLSIDVAASQACFGGPEGLPEGDGLSRVLYVYALADAMASNKGAGQALVDWSNMIGRSPSGMDCALAREILVEEQKAMISTLGVSGTPTFAVQTPKGVVVMLGDPGPEKLLSLVRGN